MTALGAQLGTVVPETQLRGKPMLRTQSATLLRDLYTSKPSSFEPFLLVRLHSPTADYE